MQAIKGLNDNESYSHEYMLDKTIVRAKIFRQNNGSDDIGAFCVVNEQNYTIE